MQLLAFLSPRQMVLTPSPISCFPKPLLLPDTLFPQSVHSSPFLYRDYSYPTKTPHLTTSQNDTSRFPVSFLHLLQPFHSHPSNTPSTDNSIFLHHLLYYLK